MRVILPQIAQITQRNTALLHYFAEKDCLELVCFGGSSAPSARSAGDILGFLCTIDWVLLRDYSPADYADYAERM